MRIIKELLRVLTDHFVFLMVSTFSVSDLTYKISDILSSVINSESALVISYLVLFITIRYVLIITMETYVFPLLEKIQPNSGLLHVLDYIIARVLSETHIFICLILLGKNIMPRISLSPNLNECLSIISSTISKYCESHYSVAHHYLETLFAKIFEFTRI